MSVVHVSSDQLTVDPGKNTGDDILSSFGTGFHKPYLTCSSLNLIDTVDEMGCIYIYTGYIKAL